MALSAIVALSSAKKYTADTADEFGAVKGAPCTVDGYETDAEGNTLVKLGWMNSKGAKQVTQIVVKRGLQGEKGDKGETGEVAISYIIVDSLPSKGESGVMYLVRKENEEEENIFDEYMFLENAWEKIGSTGTSVLPSYSTEETVIGEWLGKPIYRKVIKVPNFNVDSSNTSTEICDWDNTKKILNYGGRMDWGGSAQNYTLPLIAIGYNWQISVDAYYDASKGKLVMRHYRNSGTTNVTNCYIYVEYTKTTD